MEYFEDVTVGASATLDGYDVTEAEIIEFAQVYDPQPFHTDPDAARESMFGGLVASGWHTCAMTMRVLVDEYYPGKQALGALGIDELRFRPPVRPGDHLTVETEVVETEPFDETRGLVHTEVRAVTDDPAMTMTALVLWERRNPDE
jgi:acyl dehydratase